MQTFSKLSTVFAGTAAIATLVLAVGGAAAAVREGDYVGKNKMEVAANLKQQGYDVRKIEHEDGRLEAYALSDRNRFEIYVDPQSGNVVRIKASD